MDRPGEKFKQARERLKLTYREVEAASQRIAARRGSDEFAIVLSRLADIENKGTVPTIYRMYALCAIYRLDLHEVLRWYGVPVEQLESEALHGGLAATHLIHPTDHAPTTAFQPPESEIDLAATTFLGHLARRFGKLPLALLDGLELRQRRYGFIGLEDWSMYPLLHPGSLVVVDDSRRKITAAGWTNEFDRPIYFLEHRSGYLCGWCALAEGRLLVQSHPASQQPPRLFDRADEVDVIGQVIGVAMLLESEKRRHARPAAVPAELPSPTR